MKIYRISYCVVAEDDANILPGLLMDLETGKSKAVLPDGGNGLFKIYDQCCTLEPDYTGAKL